MTSGESLVKQVRLKNGEGIFIAEKKRCRRLSRCLGDPLGTNCVSVSRLSAHSANSA